MFRASVVLTLFAAGSVSFAWTDYVRLGNAAARAGSPDAERDYAIAEELGNDPGLVAFNRAARDFARAEYREAELNYLRCLDDGEIPPARRCRALFNRGVCLVLRGEDARIYRVAIQCFEECLRCVDGDHALASDARHNLELAKMLWNRERLRQKAPPTPNESIVDEQPRPASAIEPDRAVPGEASSQSANATPGDKIDPNSTGNATATSQQPQPGKGTLPVVKDASDVQRLSPADTRDLLDRVEARLRNERRKNEMMRAGPERPNVRDW